MWVKIPGKVRPVPPANDGSSPFTPVEFEGLTALPWIEESGSFSRIAWSFRATGVAPQEDDRPGWLHGEAPRGGRPAGRLSSKPAA